MFQWDPKGVLAAIAVLMCWALALLLFRTGARGSMSRKLSLLLVVEGLTLGSSDVLLYFLQSPDQVYAKYEWLGSVQRLVHTAGDCGMLVLYPLFLAAALNTRLTRPFADRRVQIGLALLAVVLYLLVQLTPEAVGVASMYISMVALFAFALFAALQSWRVAQGAARTRALIFVLAFGFRDLCWGYIYLAGLAEIWSGSAVIVDPDRNLGYFAYVLGTLVAVPMIAYGILRTQLFDIDLKIRWTIKQSTFGGLIIAIIFVISEGASQFLSEELGNIAGLLAAAVIVFFLAPLQRFAERVAAAAMPNTENTPEYAAFRKMQVYESAVAETLQDAGISDRERALLDRLRESLGISESDASAIERELAGTPQTG